MTDKYQMEAPIDQEIWEALPEELDSNKVQMCLCCGATLDKEIFFDTIKRHDDAYDYEKTCKVCKAKNTGTKGSLNIDYSILEKFSVEEMQSLRVAYKDYIETLDVDLEMYLALYSDFKNFLRYAWYHLGLPEPTEAQLYFADYLQNNTEHTIVNAFRGIGKSWITSVFVAWKLWLDNTLKILVVSASKERADSFSIFTKRLFEELPVLNELIPRGARTSNKAFDVGDIPPAHAPSIKSAGITGQITGSRADLIIADDVEVIDNSATEDARSKLLEKCKDFVSILVPNTKYKKSRILYLGTPQTEESIYDKMALTGYKKFIIPARYPENMAKYKGHLAKYIVDKMIADPSLVGKSTDPMRFTDEDLLTRELLIGKSTFALQFQLDTELSDMERFPLRTADLIVADLDRFRVASYMAYSSNKQHILKDLPNFGFSGDRFYTHGYIEEPFVPYTQVGMFIDPSGSGTDETGWCVIAHFAGRLYVLAFGGLQGVGYSDDNLAYLAGVMRDYKCTNCVIEDNFGDGMYSKMFTPFVRRIVGNCFMESVKTFTNKERRIIDTLEPVMVQHRLVIDKTALKAESDWVNEDRTLRQMYSLQYQMTHISKDKGSLKHDDRLDALALGVKHWEDTLNKDINKAKEDAKRKRLTDELNRLKQIHNQLYPNQANRIDKTSISRVLKRGSRQQNGRRYGLK